MNRSMLGSIAAVVLSSSLVLGATAGPATAAKPAGKGAAAATKAKSAKVRTTKPAKGAQPFTAQKRVVAKRITAADVALERQYRRVEASGIVEAPLVLANIEADRAVLTGYAADLAAATTLTEVRAVSALVGSVRPEVYSVVVNGLRLATHAGVVVTTADLEAQELAAAADAKELEGHDVTAVRTLLADVSSATTEVPTLGAAVLAAGTALTAQSSAAEREAYAAQVDALEALLDGVELSLVEAAALLAAMTPLPEPVLDPVVDPVV